MARDEGGCGCVIFAAIVIVVVVCVWLVPPTPPSPPPPVVSPPAMTEASRFRGEVVGYVHVPGSSEQPILLLTDCETGQEYLLVKGYGMSEMVTRYRGKIPVQVEEDP